MSNTQLNKGLVAPFALFEGVKNSIGRFFRPNSVGEIYDRLKKNGSLIIETSSFGKVLIEITQDKGKTVFLAIDESYKPLVIEEQEVKLFDAKVISYLNKVMKGSPTIKYGATSRLKGDKLETLKNRFITKRGRKVLLQLPNEEPLYFKTTLEAEGVLKTYYLERKTPLEESKNCGRLIFAISSLFLAGAKEINSAVSFAATLDAKWVVAASLIHLVKPILASQDNRITLVNSQPTVWIKPGELSQSLIYLNQDYECSDPYQNLKVSIQSADGSPPPDWLSVSMGPLTPLFSRYLGTDKALYVQVVGNIAYVVGVRNFYAIDLRDRSLPVLLGKTLNLVSATGLSITNNTAYILSSKNYIASIINITNPISLKHAGQINSVSNSTKFLAVIDNDLLYIVTDQYYIIKYKINDQKQLVEIKGADSTCDTFYNNIGIKIIDGYGYCFYGYFLTIFDANTLEQYNSVLPHLIAPITSIAGNKKLFFIGATQHIFIHDNINRKKPILIQTMYIGSQAVVLNMIITDDYLYAICQGGGIVVIDIRDPKNAQVVTTYDSLSEPMDAVLVGNDLCVADGPSGFTTIRADRRIVTATPGLGQEGEYNISIIAEDEQGHSLTYTQINNVGVETIPPSVVFTLESTTAQVNALFNKIIPENTFRGSNLTLTAKLSDGRPLPNWIKFDASNPTPQFSGTPTSFDAGTFSANILDIEVTAANSAGNTKTAFKVTILGKSFWLLFISYGLGFGSAAMSAYGAWQERAKIWNYLNKKKYEKNPQHAIVGQLFNYKIDLEKHEIRRIEVYKKGNLLSGNLCSPWLKTLRGIPKKRDVGRFTIVIYDQIGYIFAKFDLICKKAATDPDPDPEKVPTYKQSFAKAVNEIHERFFYKIRLVGPEKVRVP